MKQVFVESNWIVDVCAPSFQRAPDALALLECARRGEVVVHVPHIALREARSVIRRKFQPKESATLQKFRSWAAREGHIDRSDSAAANEFLTRFSNTVSAELDNVDARIQEVAGSSGLRVFGLTESMLERALVLRDEVPDPELKPFDETILAAVLVAAQTLSSNDERVFCTKDFDLSPLDKRGNPRRHLRALYDAAGLEVRTTFDLS